MIRLRSILRVVSIHEDDGVFASFSEPEVTNVLNY